MPEHRNIIEVLKRELRFLRQGGYRLAPDGWKCPLIFEDSSICPKQGSNSCSEAGCVLMDLVPVEHRLEPVACRYIPLNELKETVDSLYRTGTQDELEDALRQWLVTTITRLEAHDRDVATECSVSRNMERKPEEVDNDTPALSGSPAALAGPKRRFPCHS